MARDNLVNAMFWIPDSGFRIPDSGFCVSVSPDGICHQIMATGRISIAGVASGEMMVREKLLKILLDDPDYR